MRGLVVHGGGASHDALAEFLAGFAAVPLAALPATDLEAFDVVVVPRSCDAEALWLRRHQLARFLDRGGVLVAFGEVWTNWLPGASWEPESSEDVREPPRSHSHALVEGIAADELWWHRGPERWCSHGHLRPPAGAELVVTNASGAAWYYVDRVSTRGTIVAASNLDLDTHLWHESALARRLLERLASWLEEEAARTAALRERPSDRIAYLYSGVHFQRGFLEGELGGAFAVVPAAELVGLDLDDYPALWVPRESDQVALAAAAERITAYVRAGGTLVSFEEATRPWLPGASWRRARVDPAALARSRHQLSDALPSLERPWHAHGLIAVPDGAERLLWEPASGDAALALWHVGGGRVLAGTIDADAHAGYGSALPAAFLQSVVDWARASPLAAPTNRAAVRAAAD